MLSRTAATGFPTSVKLIIYAVGGFFHGVHTTTLGKRPLSSVPVLTKFPLRTLCIARRIAPAAISLPNSATMTDYRSCIEAPNLCYSPSVSPDSLPRSSPTVKPSDSPRTFVITLVGAFVSAFVGIFIGAVVGALVGLLLLSSPVLVLSEPWLDFGRRFCWRLGRSFRWHFGLHFCWRLGRRFCWRLGRRFFWGALVRASGVGAFDDALAGGSWTELSLAPLVGAFVGSLVGAFVGVFVGLLVRLLLLEPWSGLSVFFLCRVFVWRCHLMP